MIVGRDMGLLYLYHQAYNETEFEKLDLSSKENDIISFMKTLTDTTHKPALRLQ